MYPAPAQSEIVRASFNMRWKARAARRANDPFLSRKANFSRRLDIEIRLNTDDLTADRYRILVAVTRQFSTVSTNF